MLSLSRFDREDEAHAYVTRLLVSVTLKISTRSIYRFFFIFQIFRAYEKKIIMKF